MNNLFKGPIAWMAQNGVAANLLMLFFLLGGVFMSTRVTKEFLPNLTDDTVTVQVPYPGASPEEVEQGILRSIQERVSGLEGIKEVTATAAEGMGTVIAEVNKGANIMKVYQDIQSEVDRITTFPTDAEEPIVTIPDFKRQVIGLVIYGHTSDESLREVGERVRNRFLAAPGITQVDLTGVRNLEIAISVSQESLRRYGLTLNDVANRLKQASVDIPAGGIKSDKGEILVRMTERRDFGDEFADTTIINTADGTEIKLSDLATIEDTLEDSDKYARYNGEPSVMLKVFRVGNQTPQSVAKAIYAQLDELKSALPNGLKAAVVSDFADIYAQRADLMTRNGAMGLVLVLIFLGLFLEIRLAFWVMLGIPISFMGALLFMPVLGISLNMVTMFAFILALGIVVDDAIVVGENVYHYRQKGDSFIAAAIKGAKEVGSPVGFSILTNVVAFIPLFFLPGRMGKILGFLPIVIILAFLISWAECLFILPAHLAHTSKKEKKGFFKLLHNFQQRFSDWFIRMVHSYYRPFITFALKWRYIVALSAFCLFLITIAVIGTGHLGFQRFPKVESDYGFAYVQLPYGTPVEVTTQVAKRIEDAARKVIKKTNHPEVCEGIFTDIGAKGSHTINMQVFLADAEIRDKIINTTEFVKQWRKAIGIIPGIDFMVLKSDSGGPGGGAGLSVQLQHQDLKVLEKATTLLKKRLGDYPIVKNIDSGFQVGKSQVDFTMTPEGKSMGLTALEVARQVRNFYEGAEVVRQQRGRNELKVKVRLPLAERKSLQQLKDTIILAPNGTEVPLQEVVYWKYGRSYTVINHRDGERVVTLTADITPQSRTGEIINAIDQRIMPELLQTFPRLQYSYQGSQAEDQDTAKMMKMGVLMVLLAIYGLLAVPFKSYTQPLIVMTSIPLGLVGAVIGHLIMGYNLSIIGSIGILALSGVVVNDALVLIDFANNHRKETKTAREAIISAGVQRFRPIILTTLTTFVGLMPMIFETSRQAKFLIPMAISLGFGILFATLITLVLVPSLYMIVEDFHQFTAWLFGHESSDKTHTPE